jgi:uncharacterized protein
MPLPPRVSELAVTEGAPVTSPVLYLHGFASSPASTKAHYFGEKLALHGVGLAAPDFNEPDFATLTISRMLEQLERGIAAAGSGVTLIGSSLGAALAVLAAAKLPQSIERLILLAPAVMFAKPGHALLPPERIDEWQRRGSLPFFHHAYGEERALNYAFYADSLQHDPFEAVFTQPALVFQGLRDAIVDYRTVEQFARNRSNVTLSLVDDDHQLTASLPRMWASIEEFMGFLD